MSKLEKPIVLLVDDNEATCTLITAILRRDFEVETASEGTEAIEKLRTNDYSVLLLDIRMPGLDGYGVLEFLQATRPDVLRRTLVLTAALSGNEVARVREFPICGIVAKPFDIETLLSAVRQCAEIDRAGAGAAKLLSSGVILFLAEVIRQRWI